MGLVETLEFQKTQGSEDSFSLQNKIRGFLITEELLGLQISYLACRGLYWQRTVLAFQTKIRGGLITKELLDLQTSSMAYRGLSCV